jgi:hypothetical protein
LEQQEERKMPPKFLCPNGDGCEVWSGKLDPKDLPFNGILCGIKGPKGLILTLPRGAGNLPLLPPRPQLKRVELTNKEVLRKESSRAYLYSIT